MSKKYLDKDGLTYFWGKVKNEIPDLTNYVTKTDYATSSKGGVIKTYNSRALGMHSDGGLQTKIVSYSDYANLDNQAFIGKGTLENVITGKGLLDSGDLKTINSTSIVGSGNIATISNSYGTSQTIGYSQEYSNKNLTYSTTEIDTGKKWINGEPIYRKVITNISIPQATTKIIDSTLTNSYIDTLVFLQGSYTVTSNSYKRIIPWVDRSDVTAQIGVTVTVNGLQLNCGNNAGVGTAGIVIVEYTKATD